MTAKVYLPALKNLFGWLGIFIALAQLKVSGGTQRSDVWQWSAEIQSINDGNPPAHPRAFLWIPPDCKRVRAVVFAQNNMIEEGVLQHPFFRAELAKLGIAEIFVAPFFDYWQNATNNDSADEKFNAMVKTFANESGYKELEFVPIIPMGHSASASMPWNFAAWNPERTLAILSIKGDAPQTTLTGNGRTNLDWGSHNIDGIPGLMVMGEYEWLEDRLTPALKFRFEHANALVAMLALPGRGHFDFDDPVMLDYLTRFLRKAVKWRFSKNPFIHPSKNPILQPVNSRGGWLVDRWRKDGEPHARAAKFAKYTGNKSEAFWAFDREMAQLAEKINAREHHKQPQLLGFLQDGKIIPQTDTHNQVGLKFEPDSDGVTFRLTAAFLDNVDGGSKNTSRWTGLPANSPINHSTNGAPIKISRISGPVVQLSDDTFALQFNRFSISSDRRAGDIWLLAEHPGDASFKSIVQQALMKVPLRLMEGAEQRIAFPEIQNVKRGTKSIRLNAASDSGEKVYYYIREGPAVVVDDMLEFIKPPPRTKFPVRVTVVAWQWGRNTEPKLKSATPVERSFFITK